MIMMGIKPLMSSLELCNNHLSLDILSFFLTSQKKSQEGKNHHGPAIVHLTGNHVTRIPSPGCNILAWTLLLIGSEVSRYDLQMLTLDAVAQI